MTNRHSDKMEIHDHFQTSRVHISATVPLQFSASQITNTHDLTYFYRLLSVDFLPQGDNRHTVSDNRYKCGGRSSEGMFSGTDHGLCRGNT